VLCYTGHLFACFFLDQMFITHHRRDVARNNLKLIQFSNFILKERCSRYEKTQHLIGLNPCDPSLILKSLPIFSTLYGSGSFLVLKENIHSMPLSFYKRMYARLYQSSDSLMCAQLEYLWPMIFGGRSLSERPESILRPCGPLYFCDIDRSKGFKFYYSDDGSVEAGRVPMGYVGYAFTSPMPGEIRDTLGMDFFSLDPNKHHNDNHDEL
jgi:hypothetical protein